MKAALAAARETINPLRWLASMIAELTKARLTALVLITTLTGYFVARTGSGDWLAGLHVLLGTGLVAAGAAALNQWWERDLDRLMDRTATRPLPSGQIEPWFALALGVTASSAGILYLAVIVNVLTAVLGALAFASYVLVYTPLKRRTTLNTFIGAIPGALPPLMGWTAARGEIGVGGLALFGILFFWQIPHFMAIAWLYREQYARAGFRMMPVVDPHGRATGWSAAVCAALLLVVSVLPSSLGLAGPAYTVGALALGAAFLASSIRFMQTLDRPRARLVFFASIVYLPLLLGLLMFDSALKALG
ncbi:MAG: protoheme IX farnesyltransferase [Verrucomicrobiales bacterium]|nr:protoheme IX farnesyltransferase [Verrucomicrobiales bacterium]